MASKKLITKIEFSFGEHEEPIEFNVDMNVKTNIKHDSIKIIKGKKRKVQDPSIKLF